MDDTIKNFSVDGLELLSSGNNSTVYRLDADKIVKLYKSAALDENFVRRECNNARIAFDAGVPTPQVYGAVKVGDVFGLILERIDSQTLRDYFLENPSRVEEIAMKEAALLKKIHAIKFSVDTLPYFETVYRNRVELMRDLLTEDEVAAAHRVIDSLPLRNTYIHGDCHPANIMLRDGELILIDMANSSLGHPMYDLMSVYMFGMGFAKIFPELCKKMSGGWTFEMVSSLWQMFKRNYFGTDNPHELTELETMTEFYSLLRWLTYLKRFPFPTDDYRRHCIEVLREKFFPHVDENIPRFAKKIQLMEK